MAWRIGRRAFEAMIRDSPSSMILLQSIVLRATCLSATHALEALERSSLAEG